MEILLAVATILGGIAAVWYFWEKIFRLWHVGGLTTDAARGVPDDPPLSSASSSPVVVRAEARSYGVLMGENDGETRRALHRCRELVLTTLLDGNGRAFETHTDTIVVQFENAGDAVSFSIAARAALAEMNVSASPDARVHFRFGIDLGRVEDGPEGPGGSATERAATLGLIAHTDGIRLSEAVRMELPIDIGAALTASGEAFAIASPGSSTARDVPVQIEALELPLPRQPSIALLPFSAPGGDRESVELAEGLRIDIQNALVKMSGLFLLGAGSANAMAGTPAAEAGPRVGVRYVLEGSVRRSGEHVRVNAQLVDTVNGTVMWSERYDRPLDDKFELQDEITERIVTALNVKLTTGEQTRVWHKCLTNPHAREVFYRGIQSFFRMNAEAMASARSCFERVAELVKGSAVGPTNAAMALLLQATRGWSEDPQRARALAGEWAERAAKLGDADGQAQTVLGNVRLLQGRHDEAIATAREAVEIRPGCNNANGFLANVLLHCGDYPAAIVHAKRAIRFMPVYPSWFVEILAAAYREAGQSDFAIIAARDIMRVAPSSVNGRLVLASALVRCGWLADARRVGREVLMLDKDFSLSRYAEAQPYRDRAILDRIVEDLSKAGLPD
jgi:adenylate cyclase